MATGPKVCSTGMKPVLFEADRTFLVKWKKENNNMCFWREASRLKGDVHIHHEKHLENSLVYPPKRCKESKQHFGICGCDQNPSGPSWSQKLPK